MFPFGIRGVSLWDTGFCFVRVVEQDAIPALELARGRDLVALGVVGRALGQPPMSGHAVAVDAEARAGRHEDEAVVFEFAEPALNRPYRAGPEVIGNLTVGAIDLAVVEVVYPQIAS
jgi:hypothetical protein